MPIAVELEQITGLAEALAMLAGIETRAANYMPLLENEMLDDVHQFFADQFATQGAAGGDPWIPLTPYTIDLKARLGFGDRGILRRTDELYNSLTQRGAPLGTVEITTDQLQAGTEDPVAILHQEGFGQLPPRPLVPDTIPDQYTDQWSGRVLSYVEGEE